MKPRYRIVTDNYAGYQVQVWHWWWPFWVQAAFSNTHSTLERARKFAKNHANRIVEYVDKELTRGEL